jgi:hypothetical protein
MSALNRSAWALRDALRPELPVRSRACGRTRYVTQPVLRATGGGSYFDGVMRCRARVCPVCFLARRFKLLSEVHYVAETRSHQLHTVPLLATMTIRHSVRDGAEITKAVRRVWRKFLSGREWVDFQRRLGGVDWICAEEVTRGTGDNDNGWHPHLHVAVMPNKRPRDVLDEASWWSERWMHLVTKHMGAEHTPNFSHGFDLQHATTVEYVAKLTFESLAFEMTDAAQVKGSSPLELVKRGDVAQYMELQRMRHRQRDVTWSRSLRPLRDEFEALPKPEHEAIALFRGSEFERLASKGFRAMLDVVETHDVNALETILATHGIRAEALGVAAVNEALHPEG